MKEESKLSLDEQTLMWTSYRYCIGRKTYVSDMAYYIAKKYFPLLNEVQKENTAKDIRREIEEHMNWLPFSFKYDGSVRMEDRKPYEDCVEFIMTEIAKDGDDIQTKLYSIKEVSLYREKYSDKGPFKYHITYRPEADTRNWLTQSDIDDYQPWASLASVFDTKSHKKVYLKSDKETKEVICFETWRPMLIPVEGNKGYYQTKSWHWEKCYVSVDDFVTGGNKYRVICNEYIEKVEDYK